MTEKKFSIKKHNKSIAGKIIIAGLLAIAAILVSFSISRFTFHKVLSTVNNLSKPNIKMQLVNDLFKNVVQLDQLQRSQPALTHDTYNPFLDESKHLRELLDSLRLLSANNETQVIRIDSMKEILNKRDLLFLKYARLHTELLRGDTLEKQVKNLSHFIETARAHMDSTVVTTSKATRTIIDTVNDTEQKQSLWDRVFSKRKRRTAQVQKKIEEELKVRVDTVKLGSSGDSLAQIGKTISEVETNRMSQKSLLQERETELNTTGNVLIGQLISILNDIEHDELLRAAEQNATAETAVDKGIATTSIVFFVFVLATIVLIILIFTDISRGNRYRRELVIAKEAAEEAERVKQRFLSNMSHELRTPLQSIIGISEQVLSAPLPRLQDIENIHQSSLHLLQIVNEVLDYSRIMSGKYVIEHKPFELFAVVAGVSEMIEVQTAFKKLSFTCDIDADLGVYYSGDAFRLRQILLNVLGNAVKFTDKGTVSLQVKEEKKKDGYSSFVFTISDTGAGMSAADLAVIFNEFEQGNNGPHKHGTGLGLSIVKAMVDIQHGSIRAESIPGKGSVFTVILPYKRTEKPADEYVPALAVSGYKGHIWVIDDDPFILQLCDSILNKYNIAHTCFSSPLAANDTTFPPGLDSVFLDVRMDEMDGITLCRKLKERAVNNPPAIIAFTAQAFPEEQEIIMRQGFDALVIKPFLENDLINAVQLFSRNIPETEKIDLSLITRMTGDDGPELSRALHSFADQTTKDIELVKQSIAIRNSNLLADALHRLAGRCAQVGVRSLAEKLRTLEVSLRNDGDIDVAAAQMEPVYHAAGAIISTIKKMQAYAPIVTNC